MGTTPGATHTQSTIEQPAGPTPDRRVPATTRLRNENLDPIGLVFRLRKGVAKEPVIVTDVSGDSCIVLLDDERTKQIKISRLGERADDLNFAGKAHSAAWRLAVLSHTISEHQGLPWQPVSVLQLAYMVASRSENQKRLFALDCINNGRADLLARIDLSEGERGVALASLYLQNGEPSRAIDALCQLTQETHPLVPDLLLAAWSSITSATAPALEPLLLPLADEDPLAAALVNLLMPDRHLEMEPRPAAAFLHAISETRAPRESMIGLQSLISVANGVPATTDLSRVSPAASVYGALTYAADPEHAPPPEQLDIGELANASPAVIDEIIDGRVVGVELLDVALSVDKRYLAARVDPARLDCDDLDHLDFLPEHARRAFTAHNRERLDNLIAASGQSQDFAAVAGLGLLDELRQGRPLEAEEILALPADAQSLAAALSDALRSGVLTEPLVADRSVWPTIAHLDPPTSDAPSVRDFAVWVDLRRAHEALYSWKWSEARELASKVAEQSTDEGLRREAHALVACTTVLLGNPEQGLVMAESALVGECHENHLENLVALTPAPLLPDTLATLTDIALRHSSIRVRARAAIVGMRLWFTHYHLQRHQEGHASPIDDADQLRIGVRRLLELDMDDNTMQELLELHLVWDAGWLSRARYRNWSKGNLSSVEVLIAHAKGTGNLMATLSRELAEDPANEWLLAERQELLDRVQTNCLSETAGLEQAEQATQILDGPLPLSLDKRIDLTAAMTHAVSQTVAQGRTLVRRELVQRLADLHQTVSAERGEARLRMERVLMSAIDELALSIVVATGRHIENATRYRESNDRPRRLTEMLTPERSRSRIDPLILARGEEHLARLTSMSSPEVAKQVAEFQPRIDEARQLIERLGTT